MRSGSDNSIIHATPGASFLLTQFWILEALRYEVDFWQLDNFSVFSFPKLLRKRISVRQSFPTEYLHCPDGRPPTKHELRISNRRKRTKGRYIPPTTHTYHPHPHLTKTMQKTFILATLCSTLIGTFTASIGLWDRVNEKRAQKRKNRSQNEEIKKLKDQVSHQDVSRVRGSLTRSRDLVQREFEYGCGEWGQRIGVRDCKSNSSPASHILDILNVWISKSKLMT